MLKRWPHFLDLAFGLPASALLGLMVLGVSCSSGSSQGSAPGGGAVGGSSSSRAGASTSAGAGGGGQVAGATSGGGASAASGGASASSGQGTGSSDRPDAAVDTRAGGREGRDGAAGGAVADGRVDSRPVDSRVPDARGASPDQGPMVRDGAAGDAPVAAPGSLVNGVQWAALDGKPIQAHGGGIIKVGDHYYWFGENRNSDGTFYAVSCYRSADLVRWEFRHDVLTANSGAGLKPANIERPKVIYNASTGKYVMWMHWENGSDYGEARAATASCNSVDGDYTYHGSARPLVNSGVTDHDKPGYMSRDCTAFVDSDGKGYFLSSTNENYDLNLYRLSSDYLTIDALAATLFKGGHREAPALWKRNNVYFLLTSGATGWNPNQAQYATSTSLTSGWSAWSKVGDGTTFYSQSTFVLPIEGASGTGYLYLGDRWAGAWSSPVNDSSYVWLPITFPSATSMSMSWNNTVTIDASAGTVKGSTHKFKFVNKGNGKALSIANGASSEGDDAVTVAYAGNDEQKWSLNYDGAGFFKLTNAKSSMVLDVVSGATADGSPICQYGDNDGDNQKWRVVDKGSGLVQVLGKGSKKLVETTADGSAVTLGTASGGDEQLWEMAPAD